MFWKTFGSETSFIFVNAAPEEIISFSRNQAFGENVELKMMKRVFTKGGHILRETELLQDASLWKRICYSIDQSFEFFGERKFFFFRI